MSTATVSYKTKVREMIQSDDTKRKYIDFKKSISRSDCNLKNCQHTYYNSDMFPGMLKKATFKAQGEREWQYLDCMPECVTVDDSGFLATVTITLPQEFVR